MGNFSNYGEPFGKNDVIGSLVNLETGTTIFSKNGKAMGRAWDLKAGVWFPAFCLKETSISVNFGNQPFKHKKAEEIAKPVTESAPPKVTKTAEVAKTAEVTKPAKVANTAEVATVAKDAKNWFDHLPTEIILEIFEFLSLKDMRKLTKTCKKFQRIINEFSLFDRRELICFHTKSTWQESVLGIGLNVTMYPDGQNIKDIATQLDLLSYNAFLSGVRFSLWKEKFEHFLPLILNSDHARRALPVIEKNIVRIVENNPMSSHEFNVSMILEVLPKMMNSMVVALMKEDENGKIQTHASEKALEGYCAFHHMFLYFSQKYPSLARKVNEKVNNFAKDEKYRVKTAVPNIGEFLIYLTISDLDWKTLSIVFIKELFDRNVRWMLDPKEGNHPELEKLETDPVSEWRLRLTYDLTKTSTRLLMYQVYFLFNIGRPNNKTPTEVLRDYNCSFGRPNQQMKTDLQNACKQILKVKYWPEFFDRIYVPRPTPQFLTNLLRESVRNSLRKGYHRPKGSQKNR